MVGFFAVLFIRFLLFLFHDLGFFFNKLEFDEEEFGEI